MPFIEVSHIAINVPDLRAAEAYYCGLFDLQVAWRDSGGAASMFATWEQIDEAGAVPEVVMLWNGGFRLALAVATEIPTSEPQRVDHIGLQASLEQLRAVRRRVTSEGLTVVTERDGELLIFHDRYGYPWELDTRSFADPRVIGRQVEERQIAAKAAAAE